MADQVNVVSNVVLKVVLNVMGLNPVNIDLDYVNNVFLKKLL
jgi:hypothetical protein